MALLIFTALAALLAAVVLSGRRHERQLRSWDQVLSATAQEELQADERAVTRQMDTVEGTYELADRRRQSGDLDEACRLLDVGCRSIEAFVPGRVERLREMIRLSRAISATLPARPLRPSSFELRPLAALVAVGRAAHELLVTTSERFRLRLRILARGFMLVARSLRRDTDRASRDTTRWDSLARGRADLGTLNTATLDSYHVLLLSIERDEALANGRGAHD